MEIKWAVAFRGCLKLQENVDKAITHLYKVQFFQLLQVSNDDERQSFIDDYRMTACVSILQWFCMASSTSSIQELAYHPWPTQYLYGSLWWSVMLEGSHLRIKSIPWVLKGAKFCVKAFEGVF